MRSHISPRALTIQHLQQQLKQIAFHFPQSVSKKVTYCTCDSSESLTLSSFQQYLRFYDVFESTQQYSPSGAVPPVSSVSSPQTRLGLVQSAGRGPQSLWPLLSSPTTIVLYCFCCSSLKDSFTFALFRPPSLQRQKGII